MVAASAAAHVVVFTILSWRLGETPQVAEPPVMNVELARLARPAKPPPPVPTDRPVSRATSASPSTPAAPVRPTTPDAVTPQVAASTAPGGTDDRAQQALRRTLGCRNADLLNLSPEERQRCRDQLAAGANGAGPARVNLDRRGFGASKDIEPYLQRRPKNGCKVRAGGDAAPSGDQGAATGVGCAWAF